MRCFAWSRLIPPGRQQSKSLVRQASLIKMHTRLLDNRTVASRVAANPFGERGRIDVLRTYAGVVHALANAVVLHDPADGLIHPGNDRVRRSKRREHAEPDRRIDRQSISANVGQVDGRKSGR